MLLMCCYKTSSAQVRLYLIYGIHGLVIVFRKDSRLHQHLLKASAHGICRLLHGADNTSTSTMSHPLFAFSHQASRQSVPLCHLSFSQCPLLFSLLSK